MQKMIVVQPMECAGCRTCEMACSLVHFGVCSPALSSIRVVEWQDKGLSVPLTCLQCEKAVCMEVCQVKAIYRDENTGAMIVDEQLCIGCKMCILACPFGGPKVNRQTGKAIKCDLCGGEPQCVSVCPTKAIKYMDVNDFVMDKKKSSAAGLIKDEIKLMAYVASN